MQTDTNVVPAGTAIPVPNALVATLDESKEKEVFNPLEWVQILAGQVGLNFSEIPMEVHKELAFATSKQQVNKLFFDWFNTRPKPQATTFSAEDLKLFKTAVSIENNIEYQSLVSSRISRQRDITRLCNQVKSNAEEMAKINDKLRVLEGKAHVDLTPEIAAIIKDGWYKYESSLSMAYTTNLGQPVLAFLTPRVHVLYYNKAVGAEMSVDMGEYLIKYFARNGTIEVHTHKDNLSVGGYVHPHVAGNELCWGNASPHYSKSMADNTPSLAFKSLRVILQTYNDESPYRTISEFALARDPDVFKDKLLEFARCASNAWVRAGDLPHRYLPSGVIEERDPSDFDDEDDQLILMRVYEEQYQGTGVRIPGGDVYVRVTRDDGTIGYEDVSIDEWE